MNKKIAILLSSVVAGVGLVGATFAAWAVTDNADPFGIKISPGDIIDDVTYDKLTLEWGDTSKFVTVKNLGITTSQDDQSVYRYVHVKSTDESDAAAESGNTAGALVASYIDETVRAGNYTGAKLVDYLHVDVYKVTYNSGTKEYGEIGETPDLSLPDTGNSDGDSNALTATENIVVPNDTDQALAFRIYLPDTGITSQIYEQIKNDVVYLEINWDKPTNYAVADGSIIYYSGTHENEFTPKIYAWSSTGIAVNGEFGEVDMTYVEGSVGVYSYVLKNSFDRVIFITGGSKDNWVQTDNIEVTSLIRSSTPMYDGSAWQKLSLLGHGYYLVGSMNGWKPNAAYKLTDPVEGVYSIDVTVTDPVEFKVLYTVDNTYFAEFTNEGGDNFRLEQAATYTVRFSPGKTLKLDTQDVFISAAVKA